LAIEYEAFETRTKDKFRKPVNQYGEVCNAVYNPFKITQVVIIQVMIRVAGEVKITGNQLSIHLAIAEQLMSLMITEKTEPNKTVKLSAFTASVKDMLEEIVLN